MHSPILGSVHKVFREGVRFARSLKRSGIEADARRLKSAAIGSGGRSWSIAESDGHAKFNVSQLTGTEGAVAEIAALCDSWTKNPARTSQEKHFPINLLTADDLIAHPVFLKLALHDEIISAAAAYLDQAPRLYNLYMWWSPPNKTLKGSQLYHYDHRDSRQAKFFINISNVTDDAGPLHFFSASDSLNVDRTVGYSQDRYTDDQVYGACPKSREIQALGPPGTVYAVDTARCLHFGSRGNRTERLVLMASYARANSVNPGGSCPVLEPMRADLVRSFYAKDPVRSFVLTVPA